MIDRSSRYLFDKEGTKLFVLATGGQLLWSSVNNMHSTSEQPPARSLNKQREQSAVCVYILHCGLHTIQGCVCTYLYCMCVLTAALLQCVPTYLHIWEALMWSSPSPLVQWSSLPGYWRLIKSMGHTARWDCPCHFLLRIDKELGALSPWRACQHSHHLDARVSQSVHRQGQP